MSDKKWLSRACLAAAIGLSVSSAALVAQQGDGARPDTNEQRASAAKPKITVSSTGENAQRLRYRFSPGHESEFRIVTSLAIEGQQGEMPAQSQTMPTISQGVTATVQSVDDNGGAKVSAIIKSIGVDPAPGSQPGMDAMLRQQLNPLVGVEATYHISSRGEVSEMRLTNPAIMQGPLGEFAEQFTQNLETAAIIVPEEPVGNNGAWQVVSESEMFAIKAKQSAEYKVTSMSGSNATVDYSMKISADPQPIENPDLPPGVEVSLEDLDSSFNGRYTIDLTSPIAKGTVRSSMTIKTKVDQMGQEMRMTQTVRSTVAVTDPESNTTDDE